MTHPDSDKVPLRPTGPHGKRLISNALLPPLGCAQMLPSWSTQHLSSCHSSLGLLAGHCHHASVCARVCTHTRVRTHTHRAVHTNIYTRTHPQRHSCDLNSEMFSGDQGLTFCEADKILILPLLAEFWGSASSLSTSSAPCTE